MSYVLVQHLDPEHQSILTQLIQRATSLPVFEAVDGASVDPDCVYVIPPNRELRIVGGALRLKELEQPRGPRLLIDTFLASLAEDQRGRCAGVLLAGTGSDGTLGLKAIRAAGGLTFAQSPSSTEFGAMPASAIEAGFVDQVLPPAELAAELVARCGLRPGGSEAQVDPALLRRVCQAVFAQTGHDFSQYKTGTVQRRVERRITMTRARSWEDYITLLEANRVETEALFADLLIGVTSFFRDPLAFEALQKQVVPKLFAGKASGEVIRVWVAGCATGEEAYSVGILLEEARRAQGSAVKIQIFATDLDKEAIAHARAGLYAQTAREAITPERLAAFFTFDPGTNRLRVSKDIRDILIFSEHDLVRSPPFSRLDLVVCRNLLIYLEPELQERVLGLFRYALLPGGYLFLGNSESTLAEEFSVVDREAKIFQRAAHHERGRSVPASGVTAMRNAPLLVGAVRGPPKASARELTERALLGEYAPSAVLVDALGSIRYLHGRTGRYLEPAPGDVDTNVLKMAREGLRHVLSAALPQAAATGVEVREAGLRVKTNGDYSLVNLRVRPLGPASLNAILIIFEEPGTSDAAERSALSEPSDRPLTDVVSALKEDLRQKEQHLEATIAALETTNDALRITNEEMQSTNEELQSTNEELETSKEELQSVNEELATVNAELREKITALARTSNDLNNLLAGTGIATIFVDQLLRIQRFTPAATQVINLIPGDLGRPIGDLVPNLSTYDRLEEDLRAVLTDLEPRERQVEAKTGAWYSLRIRPYRTSENVVEGAVINFLDISAIKRAEDQALDLGRLSRLAAVVRDARDAIMVQGPLGKLLAWNFAAEQLYGWTEAEALNLSSEALVPEPLRAEAAERASRLGRGEAVEPIKTQRIRRDGEVIAVWSMATALTGGSLAPYAFALIERREPA